MRQNRIVTLAQAREAFPSLGESAACAQKLKAAIFEGIKECDMKQIMETLVQKAKQGDLAATKTLLDFVSKSAPTPQISVGARLNVAGRPPINGHRSLPAIDEPSEAEASLEELRCLVCDILQGDKLGKTLNGILQLLNQREDQPEISLELLLPVIDGMVVRGELSQAEGLYKLCRRMRAPRQPNENCA